jgi:2-dehydropantoate 2-reductase
MQFTVVGAGAIGGTVGAYAARGGEDVVLVDRDREHVEAMRGRGLTIRAYDGTFTQPVRALHPEDLGGPLDVVLLAVKAQHTEEAVRSLLPHLKPDSAVVSLQNGLCEEIIGRVAGASRTVGAFVNFNADYLEPGLVHYGGPGAFRIGETEGRISPRVEEIARRLSHLLPVRPTANIMGYLWAKLGYANMLYATALVDEPMATVLDRHRSLLVELGCELWEVADREGVRLESFDMVEPYVYYPRAQQDASAVDRSIDALTALMRRSEKQKTGVWRDLAVRRRRTEVDFHLGAAAAVGRRHGLPTSLTHRLVEMIHEIEDARRPMSWDNLAELESLRRQPV